MSETTTPVTTATAIWPAFLYRDAQAAMAFLERAFGFETAFAATRDGVVQHAELVFPGGVGIMLGQLRDDMTLEDMVPGIGSAYLVIDDPDALYARAKAAGATITKELQDETDYESRGFTCRDPEGVNWSFGTYPGAKGS
ncbi:VOC family protein [Nocardia sp. 2]|uniref:VOC family protein n=1 Tax=Nocardia acididurans TaxID=2802282 RepID=A0ABS1M7Q7_9NOCA|nr:VOC family protein [Nocardia acididurans]MBL1076180.1 VOC family protein [Nocardia acididurans]